MSSGNGAIILCVDDEANILNTLRRQLRMEGHTVHTAADALAGLQILQQEPVDVIISDYRMSGMNGLQFLEQALRVRPNARAIMLSGFADVPGVMDLLRQHSMIQFLQKPWKTEELLRAITRSEPI
ncbi:response regulator [Desulfurispirillum indicum]|uniref:response regulator n=1 Tax=Desulfurispirillum indicum TaxID=936456 RepID=UPI001CFBACDC|nr:response regulator [Desulfurispirillum indicum]UCZ57894.1 response regulator [Desulfurispirillum indicum]